MTTLKQIIEDTKERVKSDWNYKKGVSLVKQGVEMFYQELVESGDFETESEILDFIEDEISVEVARTGSIYLTCNDSWLRISDHDSELQNRWKSQALTGSVTGKLRITGNI